MDSKGLSNCFKGDVDFCTPTPETSFALLLKDFNNDTENHQQYGVDIDLPGYEDVLLLCIAEDRREYKRASMCLALRRIDAEKQTYKRFGLSTFDIAMVKFDPEM
jgi:hypothetical protein